MLNSLLWPLPTPGNHDLNKLEFTFYLPFEEDMALNLNYLEFPLPKDNLYQV
jgi:hypothetical protein